MSPGAAEVAGMNWLSQVAQYQGKVVLSKQSVHYMPRLHVVGRKISDCLAVDRFLWKDAGIFSHAIPAKLLRFPLTVYPCGDGAAEFLSTDFRSLPGDEPV